MGSRIQIVHDTRYRQKDGKGKGKEAGMVVG
jgi:hypothetical protein